MVVVAWMLCLLLRAFFMFEREDVLLCYEMASYVHDCDGEKQVEGI